MVVKTLIYPNPPQVRECLDRYHALLRHYAEIQDVIRQRIPDLTDQADQCKEAIDEVKAELRVRVETWGDYKDNEGNEARIEDRVSVSYDVAKAKACFPANVLSLVIVEMVDVTAVKGLLKGKLVTEEQLAPARIEKTVKAFIVK